MDTYRRKSLGKGLYSVRKEWPAHGHTKSIFLGKIQKFGGKYRAIIRGSVGRDTFNEAAADLNAVYEPRKA